MPTKNHFRSLLLGAASLLIAVTSMPATSVPAQAAASSIQAIVNGVVITQSDVAKRVAFLKLRRVPGNLKQKAREELVNEVLMRQEIIKVGASVSTADVDAAFARFGASNKLSTQQLTQLMQQAGVGADHFKAYIGVSMSWPRVVQFRFGNSNKLSDADVVARMKADGGKKPTTTEYFLQQIIFVVPASKRGKITGKRKSEAEASRKSYPGCAGAKVFAAGYRDVSIKDIGRIMAPQLPEEWKPLIEKTAEGGTTATKVTEKGVEYLAICKKRDVSDDMAASVVYQAEDLQKAEKAAENPDSKKYLDLLRKQSQIELR